MRCNKTSYLWPSNPKSSDEQGTTESSYSTQWRQFPFLPKSCFPTLNNWDWFVWGSLLWWLLSLVILTGKTRTMNENIFFWKITTKKSLHWGIWAEMSLIFQKWNYPWDSPLTLSPNVLKNGRHCYFCPSRSSDVETSFCKTGFSQPWAYNLSSMAL